MFVTVNTPFETATETPVPAATLAAPTALSVALDIPIVPESVIVPPVIGAEVAILVTVPPESVSVHDAVNVPPSC